MSRGQLVKRAVATVLRPHLGAERADERAAQVAQVWLYEPLTEGDVTEILRGHGGTGCVVEARSLASRVCLVLDGLG